LFLLMKPLISTGSATALAVCSLACAIAPAQAAETVRKSYDIAGGDAVNTLKRFADESGRQVVFLVDAVRGVTTNPVRGEYSAREALIRLVADTGLAFAEDAKSGALMVNRAGHEESPAAKSNQAPTPRKISQESPMKKQNVFSVLGAWLALAVTSAQAQVPAAPENFGTLQGRVLNERNAQYVEGARISIEGTGLVTLTDAEGNFRLTQVPAGAVKVQTFYTGLPRDVRSAAILAGKATELTIALGVPPKSDGDVVQLAEFQVSSSREMDASALAINEQRFAPNIKQVVSTEQFGNVAEGNTAEFLKFLPGITISYTGGNARGISIDGVPSDYVPVTIDSFNLASADGGRTNRTVMADMVSINNLSRIEVLNTPTPESPASALAGTVNMVTRSSFERAKPLFQSNVYLSMRDNAKSFKKAPGAKPGLTRNIYPGFDFSYSAPVNKKFGFSISAGDSTSYSAQDRSQATWRGTGVATGGTAFPATAFSQPYLSSYRVEDQPKITERKSFAASLDFKLSPNDRISVGFLYSSFDVQFVLHSLTFNPGGVQPGGFSSTFVRGNTGAGNVSMIHNERNRFNRTYMPSIVWRHQGPDWKADLGFGYSSATDDNHDTNQGYFRAVNATRSGLTVSFDDVTYLRPGAITVKNAAGADVNPYLISNYALTSATSQQNATRDTQKTAYGSVSRKLPTAMPVTLKAGFNLQEGLRDITDDSATYTYVGADRVASTTPVTGDDSLAPFFDPVFSQRVMPYGFPASEAPSNRKVWDHYRVQPTTFTTNANTIARNRAATSKFAREQVIAPYLRSDFDFFNQRLKIVTGVRGERTEVQAQGPLTDPRRNPNGIERGSKTEKTYDKLFPSLNASYAVRENLIGRVAAYESIGRPDYNQYAGGLTLPDTSAGDSPTNRIIVNNVDINPWSAKSLVLRLEHYFQGVGVVSVAAFRRDVRNFFGSTVQAATPEFLAAYGLDPNAYGRYGVSTQFNIPGTVRFEGVSFNYRQSLTFLPYWARGFEVFANGTSQRAVGDTGGNFAGYIPRSGSAGISFTREKYNLRVNANHRGRTRLNAVAPGASIEPGTFNWQPPSTFVDVIGEYTVRKNLSVYANLRNVTDQGATTEIYGPSTPRHARFFQTTKYGSLWTFGVNWSH
jgi:iron complex outermembrane recepter protein